MTLNLYISQYNVLCYFCSVMTWPFPCCPQRCNWGRHASPPRSSNWPVRHAGTAAHLPPQHHPLHRGDFNPAVDDRDNRSSYSGSGRIAQQVTAATTVNFTSLGEIKVNLSGWKSEMLHVPKFSFALFPSLLFLLCFQECVETLPWPQHVSASAGFPSFHGL